MKARIAVRKFSSPPNLSATYNGSSGALGSLTVELDRVSPRFEIPASHITILDSPSAFYDALKVRVEPPPRAPDVVVNRRS